MYSPLSDENLNLTESFTIYKTTKYTTSPHPSEVVESTSLSFGKSPTITYDLMFLRSEKYKQDSLSCIQLEAVALACQKHLTFTSEEYRMGFFLGDSAGIGKGRTIAGLFYENFVNKRFKGIWLTVSTDLFADCKRDCTAVSEDLNPICITPSFNFEKEILPEEGIMCITYYTLCSMTKKKCKKSRLDYIMEWFLARNDGDGLIVFDECHRGKGFEMTKIGKVLQILQNTLMNARIIYSTATAASNPRDFIYMNRLGFWPILKSRPSFVFKSAEEFISEMEKRGISAMESLAVEMKEKGLLISRMLSFRNVDSIMIKVTLDEDFETLYTKSCELWADMHEYLRAKVAEGNTKKNLSAFWMNHLNYFQTLVTSSKVSKAAQFGLQQLEEKKSVVYGIQKTGDSQFNLLTRKKIKIMERSYSHSSSIIAYVFEKLFAVDLYEYFLCHDKMECKCKECVNPNDDEDSCDDADSSSSYSATSSNSENDESDSEQILKNYDTQPCKKIKDDDMEKMVEKFKSLLNLFPKNPIDDLSFQLGGPTKVAELTGRKSRCSVFYQHTEFRCFPRKKHTTDRESNLKEIKAFQDGEKKIAIISDAASTGVSLHCDKSSTNTSKRVHITLECAFSAEKYIQQLGRTHRSNQLTAPLYVFVVSPIPAEDRFIWGISEKLSKLGAMTKGDRNTTQTFYNTDKCLNSYYGEKALKRFFKIVKNESYLINSPVPDTSEINEWLTKLGLLNSDQRKPKSNTGKNMISRFMNRVLGCPINIQKNALDLFYHLLSEEVKIALAMKTFNAGVMEYNIPANACITILNDVDFNIYENKIVYYSLEIDYGLKWEKMMSIAENFENKRFLVLKRKRSQILLAYKSSNNLTYVLQPNDCRPQPLNSFPISTLDRNQQLTITLDHESDKVIWPEAAQRIWNEQYTIMANGSCIHDFIDQRCIRENCSSGNRINYHGLVTGFLNSVWDLLEKYMGVEQFPLVRIVCEEDEKKLIGVLFNNEAGSKLCENLEELAE